MALAFNPTVAGVQAFLTELTIENEKSPNIDDVNLWLIEKSAEVSLAIGADDSIPVGVRAILEIHGRDLIQRGVAGQFRNAAIPERAFESTNNYGDILLSEYRAGLKALSTGEYAVAQAAGEYGSAAASFPAKIGFASRPL